MHKLTEQERELYDALPDVVEGHLTTVRGLLYRLYGEADLKSSGYVESYKDEEGHIREELTDLGRRSLTAAAQVAEGLDVHLWELMGVLPWPEKIADADAGNLQYLHQVAEDASARLSVIAAALRGVLEHPHPERVLWRAHDLLKQPLDDLGTWRFRAKKPKKEAA